MAFLWVTRSHDYAALDCMVSHYMTLGRPTLIKVSLQRRWDPFQWEQHCDTGAAPCTDPNRYRSSRCEHYRMKVDLSAKPFWHLAKRPIAANQEPSCPLAGNVPMTELMTSCLQYKRRCTSELRALNHRSSRPKDREDGYRKFTGKGGLSQVRIHFNCIDSL